MGTSDVNLAALIGSRICHDLISPVGAINNGLELLEMTGSRDGPEMQLISQSVGSATARIRFFRIAYGMAGNQQMGRAEIVGVLRDVMDGGRLDVAWGPMDGHPRGAVRMAFLAIQCLETAMPYGGRIEITCERQRWTVHGRGEKLNVDDALWKTLDGTAVTAEIEPAHVQFALLPAVVADAGRKLTVTGQSGDLTISF
ncbi:MULTISPECIES: histidine phosphotransferase family protein [Roseobacteraceae]|jgi:histidine phosphotransferase ChpT|uniref:Histidine phosphotransferase n=1 Tax=Pseudosulfitobacter pseudonitzschiae TaxID=1402135 RepID=A0A221K0B0_9RHOB|nr:MULTISPECIES: histidine phosphotransferase family protein [Roseobacteraceae]ASM72310.1 histidine phosphotransferase [Pseudosulfitobacter pseudonitzschiae]